METHKQKVPNTSGVRLGLELGSVTVASSHSSVCRQSRVPAIRAQIEQEENRLIMAALFGRLNSLGRFSLLLQLRFPVEGELMEGCCTKSLLTSSDVDGLELITACL